MPATGRATRTRGVPHAGWPRACRVLLARCTDWRSGGARRPRGLDQRLAALARRPSAVLPQRAGHAGVPAVIGTTAGYDPSFMAGYAKSVVFPASSTLARAGGCGLRRCSAGAGIQVLCSGVGGDRSLAHRPGVACSAGYRPGRRPSRSCSGLLYIWTDFPINYAGFGMVPYFLAIPLGLVGHGGIHPVFSNVGALGARWSTLPAGQPWSFLVHFTSRMCSLRRRRWRMPRVVRGGWLRGPSAGRDGTVDSRLGSAPGRLVDSGRGPGGQLRSGGCRGSGWRRPRGPATSRLPIRRGSGAGSVTDRDRSEPPMEAVLAGARDCRGLVDAGGAIRSRAPGSWASRRPVFSGAIWPAGSGPRLPAARPAHLRVLHGPGLAAGCRRSAEFFAPASRGRPAAARPPRLGDGRHPCSSAFAWSGYPVYELRSGSRLWAGRAVPVEPALAALALGRRPGRPAC